MNIKHAVVALSFFFLCAAYTLSDQWQVDPEKSKVSFELPAHQKKGTFSNLKAAITFDKKNLLESKINASIDVNTIKVGNEKQEEHLLSPDFFDVEKFPTITFISTEIVASGDSYIAKGHVTMKDSTKQVDLPFTFIEEGENTGIFTGTITLNAKDYGVMKGPQGKDKVMVYLEVPVTR